MWEEKYKHNPRIWGGGVFPFANRESNMAQDEFHSVGGCFWRTPV
jgi:hypothetical protein